MVNSMCDGDPGVLPRTPSLLRCFAFAWVLTQGGASNIGRKYGRWLPEDVMSSCLHATASVWTLLGLGACQRRGPWEIHGRSWKATWVRTSAFALWLEGTPLNLPRVGYSLYLYYLEAVRPMPPTRERNPFLTEGTDREGARAAARNLTRRVGNSSLCRWFKY